MSRVLLKLDASAGTIEIEADADQFESAATRAVELLRSLSGAGLAYTNPSSEKTIAETKAQTSKQTGTKSAEKKPAKRKSSGVRNLNVVEDLLNEEQREELREFYAEKSPKSQTEQVSVLCVKLMEMKEMERFTADDVYTALQAVHEETPKNLAATFNNMITRNDFGKMEDGAFVPNFVCKDFVKLRLPKENSKDG